MKFAENGRISHRQLYRQMVLAFLAPLLLCLPGAFGIRGISGILGTAAAVGALVFYVVFLIRLAPCCGDLRKTAGRVWGRAAGMFFLVFVLLTGAYLLALLEEIVPVSLVSGVDGQWISLTAVFACSAGANRGMQRRGRMAEVSGGLLLLGILLMMIVCVGQSKAGYLQEMVRSSAVTGDGFVKSCYGVLCAFSALGLLPFLLEDVEKQGSAGNSVILGLLTLGGILLGMEILLPAVFGYGRLMTEKYPVLPLLAGAALPGNVLARFDVIWMGFLLYSLLFSVGSLLHYGHLIVEKSGLGTGRVWMAAVIYGLSLAEPFGVGIEVYFGRYLAYVFVPGLLAVQVFLFWRGRGKWKKRVHLSGNDGEEAEDKACEVLENRTVSQNEDVRKGTAAVRNVGEGNETPGRNEDVMQEEAAVRKVREENETPGWNENVRFGGVNAAMRTVLIFAVILSMLCLGGCAATVEPEKRLYPLALGADVSGGEFTLAYGMPDMNESTGQDKGGDEGGALALAFRGADFREIEAAYNRSQEKFLDLGHLEVLILGRKLLREDRWREFLDYLASKPFVGEDVYVFLAENAEEVLNWRGEQNSSAGEFLTGLLENRMSGQKIRAVTLREVLHERCRTGGLPVLPAVKVAGKEMEVVWEE